MTVPYSFGTATSAIPLSQLDSNFNTPITLGNTAIQLGNTVTTLNNMTLANVTVSSVASAITVPQGGTGITSGTSGGLPYFSSTTTIASSAALAANALVVGGGAGVAPSTITTGTGVVTALGVNTGSAGAFVVNGGALGTPSSGTVTNLTGTASININGTVGATTQNTGYFTTVRLYGSSSGYVGLQGAAAAGSTTYTLPAADGTNGQVLSTNGSGTLSWATASGGSTTTISNGTSNVAIASANGNITFSTAGTANVAIIDTSGWLGVGATSPLNSNYKFSVVGNRTNLAANSSALNLYLQYSSATSGFFIGSPSADALSFSDSNGNERARIDSSGRYMVGTTTQSNGASGYNTKFTSYSTTESAMLVTDSSNATAYYPLTVWQTATTGNNLFVAFATDGTISVRGNIDFNRGAAQVRYNTSSDATLKNIIGDAPRQKSIDILNSTKIREYSWKDDPTNKPQIGVIAQELYETFKGAVSVGGEETVADEEGNKTQRYRPWAVDKTAFTFHLVAGFQHLFERLQTQQALIEQLQADVAALKGAQA